jgi:squalene synthase HpnC
MAAPSTAAASNTSTQAGPPPGQAPTASSVMPQAGAENFSVASLLLPRAERRALMGIYGFARLVDDAGDEARGDRRALLDWIEHDVGRMFDGEAIHPLLRRLAPSVRAFDLPREPFERLIAANRQDQEVRRYETYDELAAYCDLSANPVGELVLHVFRAASRERVRLSDAVCTALQLAEHWQDVGEDFRRGRIYVPIEDLARFGVGEQDLAHATPSPGLRRLLDFEVARARALLRVGVALVSGLSGTARIAVAGYVGGGLAALDAIEASGFDVLRSSPKATRMARVRATVRVLQEAGR